MPNIELTTASSQQKKDILTALSAPQYASDSGGNTIGLISPAGRPMVDFVSVLGFGARGDGIVDDTAAIQAFVTYVVANRLCGIFPAGTYNISDKITIPGGANNFDLLAVGNARIVQQTANTPIFFFADENTYRFSVWGPFQFRWGNGNAAVSVSDTLSNAIVFSATTSQGAGFYDFIIGGGLRMRNGMHLITTDPNVSAKSNGYWGGKIDGLFGESLMVGAMVRLKGTAGGWPNCSVQNMYQIAVNAQHPMIDVDQAGDWSITTVERNRAGENVTNTPKAINFTSCAAMVVEGVRLENEYYKGTINTARLIDFANSSGSARNIRLTSPFVFNLASGCALVGAFNNSASRKTIEVDGIRVDNDNNNPVFTSGSLWAVDVSTGGGGPIAMNVGPNIELNGYSGSVFSDARGTAIRNSIRYRGMNTIRGVQTGVTGVVNNVFYTNLDGAFRRIYVEEPCVIVGARLRTSAATAGSILRCDLLKNGAAIGGGAFQTTISAGGTSSELNADLFNQPGGVGAGHVFAAGDYLEARLTTNAGTLSSTTDVYVELLIVPI